MRHPEIDYRIVMERRRDELAEAEHSRLVKIALEAHDASHSPISTSWFIQFTQLVVVRLGRGMYWLGERIEGWGCQLQVRYAAAGNRRQPAPCE